MRFGVACLLVCLMLRTFEVVVWVLGWGLFVYCGFDCLLLYTSVVFVGNCLVLRTGLDGLVCVLVCWVWWFGGVLIWRVLGGWVSA